MFLSANEVSQAAFQEENARRKDFFTLLYVVERRLYSPTNIEWCLMEHCLDEINYKYADFSFLMGFVSALALRRRKGRCFISRYRLPLYVGLVGYDTGLRMTNPCPSVTFWNSVTLLESPLGETARVLHAPNCFYEVNYRNSNHSNMSTSYLSWLWNSGVFITDSLLLKSLVRYTFDQSSWRQRTDDGTVTGLVLNGRFFRWDLFEIRTHKNESSTTYDVKIALPRFVASLGLRRSYRSREMILERSSFGGKLWYSVHFALMRVLGLHGENRVE